MHICSGRQPCRVPWLRNYIFEEPPGNGKIVGWGLTFVNSFWIYLTVLMSSWVSVDSFRDIPQAVLQSFVAASLTALLSSLTTTCKLLALFCQDVEVFFCCFFTNNRRPGLCLFCCYQPSCVVSQQSWFWVFLLFHKFRILLTPPPPFRRGVAWHPRAQRHIQRAICVSGGCGRIDV